MRSVFPDRLDLKNGILAGREASVPQREMFSLPVSIYRFAGKGEVQMHKTKVKICGLRRDEDAEIVNRCKPDFVGFVLTESKRRVTIEEATRISSLLDHGILRVGVFAKESPAEIAGAAFALRLEGIQLHMDVTESFVFDLVRELRSLDPEYKPFLWQRVAVSPSAKNADDIRQGLAGLAGHEHFNAILLDTRKEKQDGGTGARFPWKPAAEYLREAGISMSSVILAGGLDEENVAEGIRFFRPYAVDVSTHVESMGYKDAAKVSRFIEAVREG